MKIQSILSLKALCSALALSLPIHFSLAVDYFWVPDTSRFWSGNNTNRALWYGESLGYPVPPSSGPTINDTITILDVGTLLLQNSNGSNNGWGARAVAEISSQYSIGSVGAGAHPDEVALLTIGDRVYLDQIGSGLAFSNTTGGTGPSGAMEVTVQGNVEVGSGTNLYLGRPEATTGAQVTYGINGFEVQGQTQVNGSLIMHSRTTNVSLGDVSIGSGGLVNLTASGVNLDGNFVREVTVRSLSGDGILEGSTIQTDGDPETSTDATLTISTLASTDASFGGLLRDGSGTNASLALEINGDGIQALTGANTYSGGTVVNGGTLLANNSSGSATGSGPVTIGSDGILGGSGSISGPVSVAGTLAAGNSIGTMSFGDTVTLEDGATILFEFLNNSEAGISYDLLVGPELDLTGASNLTLVITGLDGHTISMDDSFTLFDGTVTGFSASQFTLINDSDWTGGWQLSESSLVLTAIPEPSAAVFVLLAAAGLYTLRRRRARS